MKVIQNKFLLVRESVRLTDTIIPVIEALDAFFENAGVTAYVTSGERTSEDQLTIIKNYARRYGISGEFQEVITCDVTDRLSFGEPKLYAWQRAWSRLLNKGIVINPPVPAKVLFDYYRNGVNKKGAEIGYSPHYYGRAFDIGGGLDHDIANELEVIETAYASKKIPGFKGFLPERKNNAIHIDCQ